MGRAVHAVLVGLVGAGIVHIVVLLAMPTFAGRVVWTTLATTGDLYRPVRLDAVNDKSPLIRLDDPAIRAIACRFDLSRGRLKVGASGDVPYWSASVYDSAGNNVYSLNDRSTTGGRLDFVVLTPASMLALRAATPNAFAESVFVEAEIGEGILVVRVVQPDATWERIVGTFLDGMSCILA